MNVECPLVLRIGISQPTGKLNYRDEEIFLKPQSAFQIPKFVFLLYI